MPLLLVLVWLLDLLSLTRLDVLEMKLVWLTVVTMVLVHSTVTIVEMLAFAVEFVSHVWKLYCNMT